MLVCLSSINCILESTVIIANKMQLNLAETFCGFWHGLVANAQQIYTHFSHLAVLWPFCFVFTIGLEFFMLLTHRQHLASSLPLPFCVFGSLKQQFIYPVRYILGLIQACYPFQLLYTCPLSSVFLCMFWDIGYCLCAQCICSVAGACKCISALALQPWLIW